MSPLKAIHDFTDGCRSHSEPGSKRPSSFRRKASAHFTNILLGQFCQLVSRTNREASRMSLGAMPFTTSPALGLAARPVAISAATSSFGNHVGHIVSVGSEKKMSRIAARGIVAAMQDKQPLIKITASQKISDAACVVALSSARKLTIPFGAFRRSPRPASQGIWRACYFRSKSDGFSRSDVHAKKIHPVSRNERKDFVSLN